MAKKQRNGGSATRSAAKATGPRMLTWELAELPSSQHRTGLAGLVLMVRWLKRQPRLKGICELTRLDADGATLRIDRVGMKELFDETYAAATVEREERAVRKDREKNPIEPLRTVEREVKDEKGKVKRKTLYVYEATEPRGAFLADLDDRASGKSGLWIKMWRSFVWSLLRAIPATRHPYEDRAEGKATTDGDEAFDELTGACEASTSLPSTYFIGAQDVTAENVPFVDRRRFRFLLQFWPFAVGIYRPMVVDNEGKTDFQGYALAFPDLADILTWCDEYYPLLQARDHKALDYLPKEAVVDLPVESALDLSGRLYQRLAKKQGTLPTADLLLGVDVIHVEKEGNNVRLRSSARVEPTPAMTEEYERLRSRFWNPMFRRQVLANHIARRPLYCGFDRLFETNSHDRFFDRNKEKSYFQHDAREFFEDNEQRNPEVIA